MSTLAKLITTILVTIFLTSNTADVKNDADNTTDTANHKEIKSN